MYGKIIDVTKRPSTQKEHSIISHFDQLYKKYVPPIQFWFGVPTQVKPTDLWLLQEAIVENKPDFVLCCNLETDGDPLYLAMICSGINKGIVISINQNKTHYAHHPNLIHMTGNVTQIKTIQKVSSFTNKGTCMVIINTPKVTTSSAQKLASIVSPYQHLVFLFNQTKPQVLKTILKKSANFKRDPRFEKFVLSDTIGGFLKRVAS